MQTSGPLRQRASAWGKALAGPARFFAAATSLALAIALALLARQGTPPARIAAALGCVLALCVALGLFIVSRRRAQRPREIVRRVIVPANPPLGQRALRAATLLERQEREAALTSEAERQLARHHFERLIASASVEQVERAATRRARIFRWLGAAVSAVLFAAGVFASREIAEGFDVLVTRGELAPVRMRWTERLRMVAQPPAYLHAPARRVLAGATSLLPKGTGLTLRARPLYPGRTLVVTDGVRETPFVSDGEGGVVAHYTVEEDASLVVAARFGDVLIAEPDGVRLIALPDEAPVVTLEGAPATLRLSELERVELRYRAIDDHSLEQIDLVLRSGTREERRVLATYDDGTSQQHGGHVLSPSDPFLRSLFLPAEIHIEARDNDPVAGSKWGKSAALTLVPSAVGEADAARYAALVRARDGFVEALAVLDVEAPDEPIERQLERFEQRLSAAKRELLTALNASHGGLEVPAVLRTFALGRLRVLEDAAGRSPETRAEALGDLILGLDGALGALSASDAQRVARVLADVAEEAMVGAQHARESERRAGAIERLDRAIAVLGGGAEQLVTLGSLGNDLGSVARADLGRVRQARAASDFFHAELAARHMSERLRRPTPSFGASGSGGVEAGQGAAQEPHGQASQAQQEFDELSRRMQQLKRDHAASIERVDQAFAEARAGLDFEALRAEAERRAAELREAVAPLPEPGHSPGTAEAAAALAGEHGRAMAHNLESLRLAEALESARRALGSLDEALRKSGPLSLFDDQELRALRQRIEEHANWTEQQLAQHEQALQEKARELLQQPAQIEEQLAGSAAELGEQGSQSATPLPHETLEVLRQAEQLMRRAGKDLHDGKGESGLSLQRQAQRLLERADPTSPPKQPSSQDLDDDDGDSREPAFGGNVPEAEKKNKAEEFRRRVLESLGTHGKGRLGPAIQRYAEGLLR